MTMDQNEAAAICAAELRGQRDRAPLNGEAPHRAPRRVTELDLAVTEDVDLAVGRGDDIAPVVQHQHLGVGEHEVVVQPLRQPRQRTASAHPLDNPSARWTSVATTWTAQTDRPK